MATSLAGFSKSVNVSFQYIKEDINTLRLRSAFLEEKISELRKIDSDLRATVSAIRKVSKSSPKVESKPEKKAAPTSESEEKKGPELNFYDVKARQRFSANVYKEVVKNNTLFAVAKSPFGNYECYRILKKV